MKSLKQLTVLVCALLLSASTYATDYYVNAKTGKDSNKGTSPEKAWKSLKKVSEAKFKPGDRILLASGQEFKGSMKLYRQFGKKSKPIVISYYELDGNKTAPVINAKGELNGIRLSECSNIVIDGLTVVANGGARPKKGMRVGILYYQDTEGVYENITVKNCTVKDVFFEDPGFQRGEKEVKTANGTQSYGWGIRFLVKKNSQLNHVLVENNHVENVAHTGIKINGQIDDLKVYNNKVYKTGGPGMQFSHITNAHIKGNDVNSSGSNDDSRKWGRGSGMWTWGVDTFLIEYNQFRNANGPADSAGCHIDFNCNDVVVQYNVSENNAGGFAEILGNNWNCSYRYNVSINDGHRVKKKGVAFQEGKIYWLSGFVGKDRKRNGPYNSYFYNNTIYVKDAITAKIAVAKVAEGALVMNNIFYIEGESKAVLGDQYKPQDEGEADIPNVVFKNNLFLKPTNWPETVLIQPGAPVFGDPLFVNKGGLEIADYIPTNSELVKDKGIEIPLIPGDNKGLFPGLKMKTDILGNPIKGLPDMGAIEMK